MNFFLAVVACILALASASATDRNCFQELADSKSRGMMLGRFKPLCNADGDYQVMQCRQGYCHCVDTQTGKKIEGSQGQDRGPVNCDVDSDDEKVLQKGETCGESLHLRFGECAPGLECKRRPGLMDAPGKCTAINDDPIDIELQPPIPPIPPTECPPNVELMNCLVNPCLDASCPGDPTAICRPNYCGGCNYEFYLQEEKVDCSQKKEKVLQKGEICGESLHLRYGKCASGLECKRRPGLMDAPGKCTDIVRQKGEDCGWSLHIRFGECAPGLECKRRPGLMDASGKCTDIVRQKGEDCGWSLHIRFGECAPGLKCKHSRSGLKDAPGKCTDENEGQLQLVV